ncbi:Pentatricopeptide repeat-containing protein [Camellia lanceoleosa]|uniref:Pentatricopeptide repeat-containing protein n=1 Tax=Camellia lanceoleosa TaxID=1840588 RepID=A0ACC0FVY0_9ERIC|nr:Pentatricopeptide repeat-containing protein [Camellia lanceoleosa]
MYANQVPLVTLIHGQQESFSFGLGHCTSCFPNPHHSEVWFVKVVCTLCVRSSATSLDILGSDYFCKNLNPLIAFGVIKRLSNNNYDNPKLAFDFFDFTRLNLSFIHSIATYNLLLRSLCQMGLHDLAKLVFENMRIDGHLPDSSILGFLVSSFAHVGKFDVAKGLLTNVQSDNVEITSFVYNNLFSLLVNRNRVDEAVSFFREHILRSQCYCPDTCTFNIVIRVETEEDIVPQTFIYNPVIDGFCKAGNVDEANVIVAEMEEKRCKPDKLTFTILIIGHCMKGRMPEAISMFNKMLAIGCAPDRITINSLISCLLKAGMPNEVYRIKQTVAEDWNLEMTALRRNVPLRKNMDIQWLFN